MRSLRVAAIRRTPPFIPTISRSIRHFSIAPCLRSQEQPLPFPLDESQFAALKEQLIQREMPILREIPHGTPTALLETTLRDFLPLEFKPPNDADAAEYRRHADPAAHHAGIPFSYHLIFFPPQTSLSQLLPDSTDPAQSPGDPFDRRMWAGGSIQMNPTPMPREDHWHQPNSWHINKLNWSFRNESLACVERISDVQLKGSGDTQKIFVTLERRIGGLPVLTDKGAPSSTKKYVSDPAYVADPAVIREKLLDDELCSVIEKRNLVFMNNSRMPKPKPKSSDEPTPPPKVVKAPHPADYSVALTPNANLLFRFSALTYNAHRIHLDKDYCRNVEGHRNLLVHGPLSVVLMSEVLRGYLDRKYPALLARDKIGKRNALLKTEDADAPELITSLEYRNLAPVYAEEEMRVCLRRKDTTDTGAVYEVWVENADGSMCVRGTATTRRLDVARAKALENPEGAPSPQFALLGKFPMQGLEWEYEKYIARETKESAGVTGSDPPLRAGPSRRLRLARQASRSGGAATR